jgi:hypothetical protein
MEHSNKLLNVEPAKEDINVHHSISISMSCTFCSFDENNIEDCVCKHCACTKSNPKKIAFKDISVEDLDWCEGKFPLYKTGILKEFEKEFVVFFILRFRFSIILCLGKIAALNRKLKDFSSAEYFLFFLLGCCSSRYSSIDDLATKAVLPSLKDFGKEMLTIGPFKLLEQRIRKATRNIEKAAIISTVENILYEFSQQYIDKQRTFLSSLPDFLNNFDIEVINNARDNCLKACRKSLVQYCESWSFRGAFDDDMDMNDSVLRSLGGPSKDSGKKWRQRYSFEDLDNAAVFCLFAQRFIILKTCAGMNISLLIRSADFLSALFLKMRHEAAHEAQIETSRSHSLAIIISSGCVMELVKDAKGPIHQGQDRVPTTLHLLKRNERHGQRSSSALIHQYRTSKNIFAFDVGLFKSMFSDKFFLTLYFFVSLSL